MFAIQKKLPTKGNKFYNTTSVGGYSHCIQGKPTQSGLNVLDNCVGWSCGRFNEVYSLLSGYNGMKYWQLNCNAEDFIKRGKSIGLKYQNAPIKGGIMVWEGKGSKAGHVAFVEVNKLNNKEVMTSESGYNSFAFMNKTRKIGNGNWGANSDYKYLGCLINPMVKGEVATWQEAMNEQWHCGLAVDNSYGPKCEAQAKKHILYLGIKAPIMIKWLQYRLVELGYNIGKCGIDGSFGYDVEKAVKQYQKDHGLKVDGKVGNETYKSLTR